MLWFVHTRTSAPKIVSHDTIGLGTLEIPLRKSSCDDKAHERVHVRRRQCTGWWVPNENSTARNTFSRHNSKRRYGVKLFALFPTRFPGVASSGDSDARRIRHPVSTKNRRSTRRRTVSSAAMRNETDTVVSRFVIRPYRSAFGTKRKRSDRLPLRRAPREWLLLSSGVSFRKFLLHVKLDNVLTAVGVSIERCRAEWILLASS